jgi:glycolate oxidase iron-sulfur subunit
MSRPFASLEPLQPLMDKCVHCGFCLATCPSYLLNGQEMDSPRGRIYLMRGGLQNRVEMSAAVVGHFDSCLGCMACETACPSGVRYAPLIEETRAAIEHHHPRPLSDRLFRRALFMVLPYPWRLRLLSRPLTLTNPLFKRWPRLLGLLPRQIRNSLTLAPDPSATPAAADLPELTAAIGERRARVGVLTGCVQRVFFGHVNQATARVLAAEGCEVVAPRHQGCCGALALHTGRDAEARQFARELIETFEAYKLDTIVINAAGCGSTMKGYGDLLKDDPKWAERARAFSARVRDFSEALADLPARAARRPKKVRVAYHDACHLAHAQGVRRPPRQLLESIPDVTLVPIADADICCGSAGIFNLVEPEMAAELGRRKVARIAEAAPDIVVTSNPGCMLQMTATARAAGQKLRVLHLAEFLAEALE